MTLTAYQWDPVTDQRLGQDRPRKCDDLEHGTPGLSAVYSGPLALVAILPWATGAVQSGLTRADVLDKGRGD
ncbi:MAG: hypothetical protein R3C20_25290 [Planctomycetaceae bacterium]